MPLHTMNNARLVDLVNVLDEEAIQKLVEIYPRLESAQLANSYQNEVFSFLKMQATAMLKSGRLERADCFRKIEGMMMVMEQV